MRSPDWAEENTLESVDGVAGRSVAWAAGAKARADATPVAAQSARAGTRCVDIVIRPFRKRTSAGTRASLHAWAHDQVLRVLQRSTGRRFPRPIPLPCPASP